MKFHCPHFRTGVALTIFSATVALQLEQLPFVSHLGTLPIALLLGVVMRALLHISKDQHLGIGFSAKHFLRIGFALLGVRFNIALLAQAGPRVFLIAFSVVAFGLLVFPWVARCLGLRGSMPLLMAIDTSICGATAVGVAAPVLYAKDEDIALVVPICSLIGTAGIFMLNGIAHLLQFSPKVFGILVGATLHEVAQAMAAASMMPGALDSAVITKMMRVALLAPVIFILQVALVKDRRGKNLSNENNWRKIITSVWFLFGFLIVGLANAFLLHALPYQRNLIHNIDEKLLALATFLMAMALAGLGLQVDFERLREHGIRVAVAAIIAWLLLILLVATEIYFMRLEV
ncbi:MAG: YeiH family protein [Chthoniobacterales bacterium]